VSQVCTGCGKTVEPHQLHLAQSNPGKNGEPGDGFYMAAKCPECDAVLGRIEEPAPAPPPAAPAPQELDGVLSLGGFIGHDPAAAAIAQDEPAPAATPVREPCIPAAPAPCTPPTTDSIIETASARLAFVGAEIAKLRGFEDERALLERMIAAVAPQSGERKVS